MKGRKSMKQKVKKLLVLGMAVGLMVSSTLCVSAAGLRDVFDAKYYADTYADLKAAFGEDEEALYNHFINCGLAENRSMNPVIDVQAYRAAYPDLDAAFGDNWDAYVEHYLTQGMSEGRTEGILFNPLEYAAAYPDVAAAFGNDIIAITKHYLTCGIAEGRTAGVTAKAEEKSSSGGGSSSSSSSTQPPVSVNKPIEVYGAVVKVAATETFNLGSKTASASVTGSGTQGDQYKADVTVTSEVEIDGSYWFAVGIPVPTGESWDGAKRWLKVSSGWENLDDPAPNGTLCKTENDDQTVKYFGIGDDGLGGEAKLYLGTAEDPNSPSPNDEGVYYTLDVKFAAELPERSVLFYNVEFDEYGKVKLLKSESVQVTGGFGTAGIPYINNDKVITITKTDNNKKGTSSSKDIYWYAVALPVDSERSEYWLKISSNWENVKANQMTATDDSNKPSGNYLIYGVGEIEDEATVELCVSADSSSLSNGTYYKFKIRLVDSTEGEEEISTVSTDDVDDATVPAADDPAETGDDDGDDDGDDADNGATDNSGNDTNSDDIADADAETGENGVSS